MTSKLSDVEKALQQGIVDCAMGISVAIENVKFDRPPNGGPWAAVHVLQNQPYAATIGLGGQDGVDGLMQIDLNYPLLRGTADVTATEDLVRAFFRVGRVLIYGEVRVWVTSCGKPRNAEVDGYYRRSLTVTWDTRVDR